MGLEKIKVVLESDFGCKIEEIFAEIDSEAIAAASLAQVHRAVLRSGEEVAVKLQYPALRTQYGRDMTLIQVLVRTGD